MDNQISEHAKFIASKHVSAYAAVVDMTNWLKNNISGNEFEAKYNWEGEYSVVVGNEKIIFEVVGGGVVYHVEDVPVPE